MLLHSHLKGYDCFAYEAFGFRLLRTRRLFYRLGAILDDWQVLMAFVAVSYERDVLGRMAYSPVFSAD